MPEEVPSEISSAGARAGLSNPSRNVYIFLVLASHLTAEFFVQLDWTELVQFSPESDVF